MLTVLPAMKPVTGCQTAIEMVVIENFGACNMKCQYCFPESMWQRNGYSSRMPLERLAETMTAAMTVPTRDLIHIRFAGGEPLLAGIEWLAAAVGICRDTATREKKRVSFSVQTNATHITPDLAVFLRDNAFEVGVSIDGPADLNEITRGHTAETLRGFSLLADAFGRPPGVIVTVTKCNALRMKDVVEFLDALGVRFFRANLVGGASSHIRPTSSDFGIAREDILRAIVSRRGRIMEYNTAESMRKLDRWVCEDADPFGSEYGCHGQRCPAGKRLMYFNQRGNAYACPRANVSTDTTISSSQSKAFAEDWELAVLKLDDAMQPASECLSCAARVVCDFGCHAFNTSDPLFFQTNCGASKHFYQFVVDHLTDVAAVVALVKWRNTIRETGDISLIGTGLPVDAEEIDRWSALCSSRLLAWHETNAIQMSDLSL